MSEPLTTFLIVVAFITVGTAAYTGLVGAPWVPTRKKERRRALEMAELNDTKTMYDLGSGTGTLLFEAAQAHPNARIIGIELFVLPYLYARIRKLAGGRRYKNVSLLFRDFYFHDLSDADVVFAFLMTGVYSRLKKKLSRELKDDCRIIIEAWPFEDIEPLAQTNDRGNIPLYLFRGKQLRVAS